MRYSFIGPRKKNILSSEMQLLFTFFSITIFMLFVTYLFLIFKEYKFAQNLKEVSNTQVELKKNITQMQDQITFIEKETLQYETINTKNTVLKDSIANLFDLVPQRITLSQATLLENGLILYGVTPNKDTYNFMLQAPLRSIFHKTYSNFYAMQNGWLRFVSTNYTDYETEGKQGFFNED
ncbi:MAG: hypothetical protein JJW00_05775 [Sulfurimonas sp.]|nr:hypothetical protein [Sulfurimonas sp.]